MIKEGTKERNISVIVENEIKILTLKVERHLDDMSIREEKRRKEEEKKAEKLKQEKQQKEYEGVSGLRKSSLESFVMFCNSEVLDIQKQSLNNKIELDKIAINVDARRHKREQRKHSSI